MTSNEPRGEMFIEISCDVAGIAPDVRARMDALDSNIRLRQSSGPDWRAIGATVVAVLLVVAWLAAAIWYVASLAAAGQL